MTKPFTQRVAALLSALLLSTPALAQDARTDLLLYSGITLVRPMAEMARVFEKRENVRITIAQGASEDIYQSAKKSGVGDWYLPGEASFREEHLHEGLLGEQVVIGHNQVALMVQKGNPKQVKADAHELLRKDLVVILGNAESGAIGRESKRILDALGIYPQVVRQAAFLSADSRSVANSMKKGDVDVTLNFRAVAFFPDNAAKLEAIDLDPRIARPLPLPLSLLKSSRYPELARRFMAFAVSEEGQAIMRKHGFLDSRQAGGK
jgi:molybdate transport system substrate-binding protein